MNKVLLVIYMMIGMAYGNTIYSNTNNLSISIGQGVTWPMAVGILLAEGYDKVAIAKNEN